MDFDDVPFLAVVCVAIDCHLSTSRPPCFPPLTLLHQLVFSILIHAGPFEFAPQVDRVLSSNEVGTGKDGRPLARTRE